MYYITVNFILLDTYEYLNFNFFNISLNKLNNFYFNLFILFYFILFYLNIQKFFKIIFLLLVYILSINIKYKFILTNFYFGFYKIHPPLLYVITLTLIYNVLKRDKIFKYNLKNIFIFLTITLIWGSLWALTQTVWSKYWSNDSIEIILILIIANVILFSHLNFKYKKIFNELVFFSILFLLILLRLNFIFTKHNFFQKTINFQNYLYLLYLFNFYFIFNLKISKYYFSIISYIKILLIFIVFLVMFNFLNLYYIKNILYFSGNVLISLTIVYLFKFLNKFYYLHIFYFTVLIIFNIFYINYTSNFSIYINNKNIIFENNFFFFKKKNNLWIWKNSSIITNLYHYFIILKNFNKITFFNKLQTKLLNFF